MLRSTSLVLVLLCLCTPAAAQSTRVDAIVSGGDEGTVVALYWSTEAIVVSFEDGSENVPPGALERIEA